MTLLLSGINTLNDNIVLKGGTCLSKIYYSYYRLSEDLDFTLIMPKGKVTRLMRRNAIKPVKEKIQSFAKGFGMRIENVDKAGHNESTQYIYYVNYDSVVLGKKQSIKIEIGLRFNPFLTCSKQKVNHKFMHPFTKEPLLDGGVVYCLAIKELVAEKMRATATRLAIAPRDFYDLGFLVKADFNFRDNELWKLFKRKLDEDGFDNNLSKYRINMGRSEKEIKEMDSRIETELLDVLTLEEKKAFNLNSTLRIINQALGEMN
jgi:predicted nucleotidyltransferase component of viral defense system